MDVVAREVQCKPEEENIIHEKSAIVDYKERFFTTRI